MDRIVSTVCTKEEEKPFTYYGSLIHVKQESEIHVPDDGMSNSSGFIKEEKIDETITKSTIQEKVLKSQSRELVLKVRDFFEKEKENGGPFIRVHEVLKRTAAATQVSVQTIRRISLEKYGEDGSQIALKTPGKKRPRLCPRTTMDLFQEEATRRHIYEYYERKEYPTIARLLVSLNEANIYSGSRTSLLFILKNLGFYWKRFPRNRKFLMERRNIVACRGRFLRSIAKVNFNDVIWVWADDTAYGTMSAQITRGSRLILFHAATSSGFIPNALLLLDGEKITSNCNNQMSNFILKHWFEKQLLPSIKRNSVVVMDSASYETIIIDKIPSMLWKKQDIKEWIESKNIECDSKMPKAELLELARLYRSAQPIEVMDNMVTNHGHKVVLLPPNHCYFNPIEIIWAQIKHCIANQNKTFKLNEITKFIQEKIEGITTEEWKKVVEHVEKSIKDQNDLEDMLERRVEEMIISLISSDVVEDGKGMENILSLL